MHVLTVKKATFIAISYESMIDFSNNKIIQFLNKIYISTNQFLIFIKHLILYSEWLNLSSNSGYFFIKNEVNTHEYSLFSDLFFLTCLR